MRFKRVAIALLLCTLGAASAHGLATLLRPVIPHEADKPPPQISAGAARYKPPAFSRQNSALNQSPKPVIDHTKVFAGCYDINWATWSTFDDVTSTTGNIIDADGTPISITMSANYSFGSTPGIYNYPRLSSYPATIPNQTVPKTTWAAGVGGETTMCFSRKVTNPVLLLASLGSTLPQSATLDFSVPYVVLYDGGNMVYNSSTRLTGTEGYAIVMFPGDFTCVTIKSSTPENYTNLTWGIRPQPFTIGFNQNATCGSTAVTATGGTTYQWNGGDTPNQATNTFHTSGTYLVTVTNSSGCVTSASVDVVVSNSVTPSITAFTIPQQSGATVINEANKTITLTMPAGTNLASLTPSITVPSGTTVSPASGTARNFTNPVTYTVTGGCGVVTYTVRVLAAKPATTCAGVSNIITGDTPTPAGTFAWQVLQGGNWVNAPGTINGANYQTSGLANTTSANITYILRRQVTAAGGVITYDSFYDLTVEPTIAITNNIATASGVSMFCATGDPAAITGSAPAGGNGTYTYQWQSSADNITFSNIAGATAKDYDPPAITATTYYRRIVSSGSCNTPNTSNAVTVTVVPVAAGNAVTAPAITSFCSTGDAAIINGTTPTGGDGVYQYQWQSSADNVTFTNIAGATAKDYDPPAINTTTYYRRIVTSAPCSTPLTSNVVTITITPAVANNTITAPAVTSFCNTGDAAAIVGSTPTGGTGTYQYQWQSSADNTTFTNIAGANAKDYDPAISSTTMYYRRSVISGICNVPVLSNVVTINIQPQPGNVVVTPVNPVCAGSRATISVSSPNAALSYFWYDSPAKGAILFAGPTFITGPLTASHTYYVEASNGSCSSLALTSITVTTIPVPAAPALVNPVPVCSGTPATLNIAGPQATLTYNWYSTATGGTPIFTGPQFVTNALTANATYYVDATNASGCISPRTTAGVTVNALPAITAQGVTVCAGSGATLTASSTDNNVTIRWYQSAAGGSSVFTGASYPAPAVSSQTTYYAEATNNSTGCISATRAAAVIQIAQPLPAPVVTTGDITATSVTFKWAAVTNATAYQVSTDNGQSFSTPSSGNAGLTHTITGLTVGQTVNIIVRASGTLNCLLSSNSATAAATTVDPLADDIFVANGFTPNGDGKNDVVYVHNDNISTMKFYVYSQWGELLFSTQNIQNGWDGTYKGQPEPAGVYVYYVQATMKSGKQVNKKGTITLIR
ncbi:Ig-like domain-containing protein [Mucilaginibacter pedocola]|uniref:PKD domain-containing protein n=1 Tax=Mucilaginibacter pedocola TaxID=1792845 RepID=A0A1S9PCD5_9SPHI|nr:gliding motility-associated C-terminal domain-containing protein [Mucilaginibacter pedocola]OOQ58620.1 hypothetical protein BC343_08115 [Mucilaginibacter pedocola]